MAVTQIHPIETTLHLALDYIMNPEKTEEKLLISGYKCEPDLADLTFKLTKREAGKENNVLAYHTIQSFKPGEVDYETAHEIGKQLATKITTGKFEFVVSTHVDREHVHNHIIFNSVSYDTHKKFDMAWSAFKIQELSDELCKQYGLSVIEEKSGERGKTYKEYLEDKKGTSWKSKLRETVDKNILKAQSWEEFLALMKADKYEMKHGKHISFRAADQTRFTRAKTLGNSYTEEQICARIADKIKVVGSSATTVSERKSVPKTDSHGIKLLIDIENNLKMKQSAGLAHWAKIQNIKTIAKTTEYITDKGLTDYNVLSQKHSDIKSKMERSRVEIKRVEKRINELKKMIEVLDNYRKYRNNLGTSEQILWKAAQQQLPIYFDVKNLPLIKDLRAELNQLYPEKNSLYNDYYTAKNELKEFEVIKKNVDTILGKTPQKSQESELEHGKKSRTSDNEELT